MSSSNGNHGQNLEDFLRSLAAVEVTEQELLHTYHGTKEILEHLLEGHECDCESCRNSLYRVTIKQIDRGVQLSLQKYIRVFGGKKDKSDGPAVEIAISQD